LFIVVATTIISKEMIMTKRVPNKQFKLSQTVIYQSKAGSLEIKADAEYETIWLTQDQIAVLFDVQKAAISKHLKNIFFSGELKENSVVSILETNAKDSA
jgi:hypothetical protein